MFNGGVTPLLVLSLLHSAHFSYAIHLLESFSKVLLLPFSSNHLTLGMSIFNSPMLLDVQVLPHLHI